MTAINNTTHIQWIPFTVHVPENAEPAALLAAWDDHVKADRVLELIHQADLENSHTHFKIIRAVFADPDRRTYLFAELRRYPNALQWIWRNRSAEELSLLWDECLVFGSLEIDFLHFVEVNETFQSIFSDGQRRVRLLEKYANNPEALAMVWKTLTTNQKNYVWLQTIVRNRWEIPFLSRIAAVCDPIINGEKNRSDLIQSYANQAPALAVIFKVINVHSQKKLWDEVIVRKNLEVEFLSHVDSPGCVSCHTMKPILESKDSRFRKTRTEALLKKYRKNPAAVDLFREITRRSADILLNKQALYVTIWPMYTSEAKIECWDDHIVRNNLEISFLVTLQNMNDERVQDVREVLRQGGRLEALLDKYRDCPESLEAIQPTLQGL